MEISTYRDMFMLRKWEARLSFLSVHTRKPVICIFIEQVLALLHLNDEMAPKIEYKNTKGSITLRIGIPRIVPDISQQFLTHSDYIPP
jgi:hypothetical protein